VTIKLKIQNGEVCPKDGRGTHLNRPHRIEEDTKEQIRAHIREFPKYESHYTRNIGDLENRCLEPHLSLAKMYRLYVERMNQQAAPQSKFWLYRHIFYTEFKLKFGMPKLDCCDYCDK